MRAVELMTADPRTIRETESVATAVEILQSMDIRHLPVINEMNELVGMLSDRDLRALLRPFFHLREPAESVMTSQRSPVSTVMSSDVVMAEEEDEIEDVVELMLENKVGAVPIVGEGRQVVGIISYLDLLREWPAARA